MSTSIHRRSRSLKETVLLLSECAKWKFSCPIVCWKYVRKEVNNCVTFIGVIYGDLPWRAAGRTRSILFASPEVPLDRSTNKKVSGSWICVMILQNIESIGSSMKPIAVNIADCNDYQMAQSIHIVRTCKWISVANLNT